MKNNYLLNNLSQDTAIDTSSPDQDDDNDRMELIQKKHERKHKVGVFTVVLAIIGSIVGGGVVSMPYASLQTGFWISLAVNIYSFICGVYSVYLLLEAKNMSGLASFAQLGYYCFGRISIFVICACLAFGSVGFPIVYFKIFGEASSSLLNKIDSIKGTVWSSKAFTQITLGVILFIFVIKKRITELKLAGFLLLSCLIFFVFCLLIRYIQGKGKDISDFNMSKINFGMNFVANIPTLILSYGFQPAFFPAFNSLKEKTDKNGIKATLLSFIICFTVYISIILISFFTYGDEIEPNILTNVGRSSDAFSIILQSLFLIISAMHIPMVYYIGKECLLIIVDELVRKTYSAGHGLRESLKHYSETPKVEFNEDKHDAYMTLNPLIYYGVSIGVYVAIVACSILVDNLVFLLGIIGSTAATFVIYIGPAGFYIQSYRLLKKMDTRHINYEPNGTLNYYIAWVFLIKGFVLMLALNFATIYNII